MYSYRETVKNDVREWMEENYTQWQDLTECEADEYVYDACWVSDSVTGNASGSYTFSRLEARDNFFNDSESEEYLDDMISEEFTSCIEIGDCVRNSDWEKLDVLIRCWLLGQAVHEVVMEKF